MLKQLTRSSITALTLVVLFAGASASAASFMRPASGTASHATSVRPEVKHKPRHKKGAVVHRAEPSSADVSAATVLLGQTAVESQYDMLAAGQAEAFRLRASASGLAWLAHVYISGGNAAIKVIVGIYSSSSGQPGTLLSTGSAPASSAGTWTAVPIQSVDLVSGTTYWLAILGKGGTLHYRDRWRGYCPSETSEQSNLARMPSAWRVGTTYSDCPASAFVTTTTSILQNEPPPSSPPTSPPSEGPPSEGTPPPPAAPANTAPPTVSGSTVEGQMLSASTGTWSGSPTSYADQWEACNALGEGCLDVAGATSASHQLAASEVGGTMRLAVTASNAGGSTQASSASTALVESVTPAPTNTVLPAISGSTVEGQTLSVSTGTWSESPTSYAYQWWDCNTAGNSCSNITGATSSTYQLASSDVGDTLRVAVTATNDGGSTQANSHASATVVPTAPVNSAQPAISGSAAEGQTLSASTGTWSGSPTSYTYQWEDCNTAGHSCSSIGGAISSTYQLASSDVGHTLRAAVTATNAGGSTKSSSAASATVVSAAPVNSVLPSVGGTAEEGMTLSASTGTWSGSPTSYAYQWEDCNSSGASCSAISGATASTRVLAAGDVGHALRVLVTATNAGGSAQATSPASATVVAIPPVAPTDSVLPTISGSAVEGQTLSASVGTWSGSPTSYAYQWQDCSALGEGCVSIGGATSSSHKLTAGDVGDTLRVVVTATNAAGSTPASSLASAVVATPPAAPTDTVSPAVSGTAEEGRTLSASTGTWTGSPTSYGYQWKDCNTSGASCSNIVGATASTRVLASSDVGHTLVVVVSATNAGGTGEATSAATGTVVVDPPVAPTNTVLPSISGSAEEGKTLSASTGTWTGSPNSYAYQWEDCSALGEGCTNIAGATASSYALVASDVGSTIRVVVKASNAGGSTSASSAATSATTKAGAQTLNCFSTPGACGYPDPAYANVGPTKACSELTPSGSKTISKEGEELKGVNITGNLAVTARKVVVNEVCVTLNGEGNGSNSAIVRLEGGEDKILHSRIEGKNATTESIGEAIRSGNSANETAEYDVLKNCSECLHDNNWTANNDYIEDNGVAFSEGYSGGKGKGGRPHTESLYCNNCTASMNHDTFILPEGQTATTIFAATNEQSDNTGPCSNTLSVTNSFMVGGGFLIYQCANATSVGTASLTFTGNDIARCTTTPIVQVTSEAGDGGSQCKGDKTYSYAEPDKDADSHGYYPYGAFYGVASYTYCEAGSTKWSNNRWDDNGASIGC
jgi:hypothetical protein